MPGGFSNKPRILRGAFVEYGVTVSPLVVVFQFNPVELSRSRGASFHAPRRATTDERATAAGRSEAELLEFHKRGLYIDLVKLQEEQHVNQQEESIRLDIRLDATDKLNKGDLVTRQFGIAPQLATLELMMRPREGRVGFPGATLLTLLASSKGFSHTAEPKPPIVLFIWGRHRVLPVNISSMNITESEFDTRLNPTRATVSVDMTVIEGVNIPFIYSMVFKETTAFQNLTTLGEVTDVVIPE